MSRSRAEEAAVALEGARRGAVARTAQPILWTIHRSLGRADRPLHREHYAQEELAAARQLIEELAMNVDDAALSEHVVRAALDSLPKEKPLRRRPLPAGRERESSRPWRAGCTSLPAEP